MKGDDFLAVAVRIGRRLTRQALWDGSTCTWEIQVPDHSDPDRAVPQQASGPLYQGTAGIAWFLAELAEATDDAELARTAEGALRHALENGHEILPTLFGFHSGRVGIAWTAARAARTLGKAEFLDRAWQLLEPLLGRESQDRGLDVVSGAAGAIPALLELGDMLQRDEPVDMARRLGEHLIRHAHREPDGWSWAMMTDTVTRHLTGLAHGTAGAGLALLELEQRCGEARFCFAAEMAFLYERRFFDPYASNWPDLRNNELGKFLYYDGGRDELLERARQGTLPPYETSYMTAWCHGSPGIGLSRLRAFELTGQELYRQEAEAAVASTLAALTGPQLEQGNFSLCHGIAGNGALPLAAAALLDEPSWHERVVEVAQYGWERYEKAGQPWPCGTVNQVCDPSLLLGEAGIGMFYLRLARPDVPSPLLLRPEHGTEAWAPADADELAHLARESAGEYFAVSLRAVEGLASSPPWTPSSTNGQPLTETPAETFHAFLHRRIETTEGEARELLDDASRVERERFQATRALDDFSAEFVRGLTAASWDEHEIERTRFERAPDSRLLTVRRDWQGWNGETDTALPVEDQAHILLYRRRNRIHPQRVGALAALLLDVLEQPVTLAALVDRAAGSLDGPIDRTALKGMVLPQLEALYRAGFVVGRHVV